MADKTKSVLGLLREAGQPTESQDLPHKILLYLSSGALPGSPGSDFVATYPDRLKEETALGIDHEAFLDMSPAELRLAVRKKAEYDGAREIEREILAASREPAAALVNQSPVDRKALYQTAAVRHPEWKERQFSAWCTSQGFSYKEFRAWLKSKERSEKPGTLVYPDGSPKAILIALALQK